MEETKETKSAWEPYSWCKLPTRQQPQYPDSEKLKSTIEIISNLPSIVKVEQITQLKSSLEECCEGKKMIIHMGDCSESFEECNKTSITQRFSLITLSQLILQKMLDIPVIKIGRIAGQYAKPRSSPIEEVNGVKMTSFYGDNVNKFDPVLEDRIPNPERLIEGYNCSAITYQTIRRLEKKDNIDDIIKEVMDSQIKKCDKLDKDDEDFEDFMITLQSIYPICTDIDNLYISHEGLLLNYEAALTKPQQKVAKLDILESKVKQIDILPKSKEESHKVIAQLTTTSQLSIESKPEFVDKDEENIEKYYNQSAHYLWIGERTNKLNEAHLEYFRGISNPIGMKCGPSTAPEDFVKAVKFLNPDNEKGRIVLITRFGASKIEKALPPIIKEIVKNELNVIWVCDAVHGNTYTNEHKIKVRDIEAVYQELTLTYKILTQNNQHFGGIHLETSADFVTECMGGITMTTDARHTYTSKCDPRLNFVQTLHILYKFCKYVESNKITE